MTTRLALCIACTLALGACAPMARTASTPFSQADLPVAVQVPAGNSLKLETTASGEITYECRPQKDNSAMYEWFFVGPKAQLMTRQGQKIGTYYGPPATWESSDGSKVTATQVAIAPAGQGNIPMQLVKANPAMGMGAMQGTSYIQRVATKGGVAPAKACAAANLGEKQIVNYSADYIFWRAN